MHSLKDKKKSRSYGSIQLSPLEIAKDSSYAVLKSLATGTRKVTSSIPTPHAIVATAVIDGISHAYSHISNYYNQSSVENEGTESNNIQEKSESQHAKRKKEVDFRRPNVVDNFVGRKDVLRELKKSFKKKKGGFGKNSSLIEAFRKLSANKREEFQKVCIAGIGGLGKTQVVAKYLKDCEKKKLYGSTYWINAEERSCLDKSFVELAKRLEIEENGLGEFGLINKVYAKINELSEKAERSTIIVFDNADDSYLIKDYLPSPNYEFINLLITSRWRRWENMEIRVIPLNPFTPQESEEFIRKEVRKSNVNKEIEKLAKKLGHLPLALKQATAYINQEKISIKEYLRRYEKKADELLGFGFLGYNDQYKETVLTTWLVTLDKIKKKEAGKNAMEILNVMAYLAPDDIEGSMLSTLDIGRSELTSAIELLKNYSMIDQGKKDGLLNIHRLVQEIIRIGLQTEGKEKEVLRNAIQAIKKVSISESYLESFMYVCKHAMKYSNLNGQVKGAFELLKEKLITKKADEKYLRIAGEFLLAAVKSDNQELVKFALDHTSTDLKTQEKWQEGYPILNIILSCKGKEMMKHLKDLGLNVKLNYKQSATYVILHDNCVAALEFLIDNNMLNELEKHQWLEQAILEVREDIVALLLEKQLNLSLENVTRSYNRGLSCFGNVPGRVGSCASILEFAEQRYEKINKERKEEREEKELFP